MNRRRRSVTKSAASSSSVANEKSSRSATTHPTPSVLDRFIPWMFMELQTEQTVVVRRVNQENYPQKSATTNASRVSVMSKLSSKVSLLRSVDSNENTDPATAATASDENIIQLTTIHNKSGRVVGITIDDSPFPINRKLIEVISLCLPFHPFLNKLSCKGKGLDYNVIKEIAKMLPFSHLTDICLDNTFVPQGNYYILLDQASTLNCLSLSRCKINDVVCKKIAQRLEFGSPASENLRVLCLSSNFITDIGAQALGHLLKTNRNILHLNLCGNNITSVGAGYLLEPLSEFLLTTSDISEMIRWRREHYKATLAVVPIPEPSTDINIDLKSTTGKKEEIKSFLKKSIAIEPITDVNRDEKMREEYIFGPSNTVYKNGCWFAAGNLALSSLNLGYNCLDYTSLLKIVDVLTYQMEQDRSPGYTGLLRAVIEGNDLPVNCEEYSKIDMFLGILQNEAISFRKKRDSSTSRITRRSTVQLITPRAKVGDRSSV